MRNMHKFEELFPDEFKAEVTRSPIVYCSFSPPEYHGSHGTMGMDLFKGYEICLRAVEISGGIVYPLVPIAPGGNPLKNREELRALAHIAYPSAFFSAELCEKLYTEMFEVFALELGFKVCVFMGSHGPAGILAKKIAAATPVFHGMKILAVGSLTHNKDVLDAEYKRLGINRISHAGMWESAMLMVSNPEFVDPEKMKTIPDGPAEKYSDERYGPHTRPRYEEISKVTREFGERLIQTAAERIAAEALAALESLPPSN